uniref:Transforming, acidic coiled-coil containing protein 3 n=1 Tax=Echeneis naucrates TaxID=173247 RepID=A0A665WIN0_ECHNA
MTSVEVNDENCGVCPSGKLNTSNNDIFALDQPTGRPSILRQTENLPNKTLAKGVKVCFQTPRRDPVTKRILSPTKSVRMTSVDECTKAMEFIDLDKTDALLQETTPKSDEPKQEVSSYPDDDMPIRSKGGYQLDFDNLEMINPFQGSNMMVLSPGRPHEILVPNKCLNVSFLFITHIFVQWQTAASDHDEITELSEQPQPEQKSEPLISDFCDDFVPAMTCK